jgi:hypothetical protein
MTAKSIRHKFTTGVADGADTSVVRPSNWNDDHNLFFGINPQTGTSYTFVDGDSLTRVTTSNSASIAVTLPQAGASSLFLSGWVTWYQNIGTGTATITPTTSTIDGASSSAYPPGHGALIFSDGTNYGTIPLVPRASPALTGTPTGPTASVGTNTTQLATTAFVKAAIDALINAAPGALDTLKELADAIGDDSNFATTMTNALALKAPLASPALTGNPTAPTASAGDNDTSIATTAFVQAALDAQAVQFDGAQSLSASQRSQAIVNIGGLVAMHGKCRLTKSGANLLLSPSAGNTIVINSTVCVIPDAGVTLAPPATNATNYFIYAYMNSGTMTLEASTTGHTTQAGTGIEIKSGDATRSLVGQARTVSSAWVDTATQRFVLSWFNRRDLSLEGTFSSDTTSSSSVVTIGTNPLISFLSWSDDAVGLWATGAAKSSAAGGVRVTSYISIDSVAQSSNSFFESGNADFYYPVAVATTVALSEDSHTVSLAGKTGSGTATWILLTINARIRG